MTLPTAYRPFFVGFEDIFDKMESFTKTLPTGFPPYNIRKVEDNKYVIELAVAGFAKNDLEIELAGDVLKISGKASENTEELSPSWDFCTQFRAYIQCS
jgi:molecular chaperone IbpA